MATLPCSRCWRILAIPRFVAKLRLSTAAELSPFRAFALVRHASSTSSRRVPKPNHLSPKPMPKSFLELGIPEELSSGLRRQGIFVPSPIQAAAIPPLCAEISSPRATADGALAPTKPSRHSTPPQVTCIHAPTGTGKTFAFLLPLLTRFLFPIPARDERLTGLSPAGGVVAMVIVPSRELALQVYSECLRLGSDMAASSSSAQSANSEVATDSGAHGKSKPFAKSARWEEEEEAKRSFEGFCMNKSGLVNEATGPEGGGSVSRDKCNSLRVVLTIAGLMPSSEQRRRLRSLTDRGHNLLVIGTASRVNEIFDVEDEEVNSFMYEADDEELNLGRGRAGGGGQNMEERGKASTEDEDRGDAVAPSLRGVQAVVVDEADSIVKAVYTKGNYQKSFKERKILRAAHTKPAVQLLEKLHRLSPNVRLTCSSATLSFTCREELKRIGFRGVKLIRPAGADFQSKMKPPGDVTHRYAVCSALTAAPASSQEDQFQTREKLRAVAKILREPSNEGSPSGPALVFVHNHTSMASIEQFASKELKLDALLLHEHINALDLVARQQFLDSLVSRSPQEASNTRHRAPDVLIATEIVANGLDLRGITQVFILAPLLLPASYLHLAGRVGRLQPASSSPAAAAVDTPSATSGLVTSVLARWENNARFKNLQRKLGLQMVPVQGFE